MKRTEYIEWISNRFDSSDVKSKQFLSRLESPENISLEDLKDIKKLVSDYSYTIDTEKDLKFDGLSKYLDTRLMNFKKDSKLDFRQIASEIVSEFTVVTSILSAIFYSVFDLAIHLSLTQKQTDSMLKLVLFLQFCGKLIALPFTAAGAAIIGAMAGAIFGVIAAGITAIISKISKYSHKRSLERSQKIFKKIVSLDPPIIMDSTIPNSFRKEAIEFSKYKLSKNVKPVNISSEDYAKRKDQIIDRIISHLSSGSCFASDYERDYELKKSEKFIKLLRQISNSQDISIEKLKIFYSSVFETSVSNISVDEIENKVYSLSNWCGDSKKCDFDSIYIINKIKSLDGEIFTNTRRSPESPKSNRNPNQLAQNCILMDGVNHSPENSIVGRQLQHSI